VIHNGPRGSLEARIVKPKVVIRVLAAAIVGTLLAWVAVRLDWRELAQRLGGASVPDLALMAGAWVLAWLLRPLRFRYLLSVLGDVRNVQYRTIWAALVLGATVNSFAPMRAGDIVLAMYLRKRLGVAVHRSLSVIVADWLCDFLCVVVAFLGALAFAPTLAAWTDRATTALAIMSAVGLGGLSLVLLLRNKLVAMLDLVLAKFLPRWQASARETAEQFLSSLAAISRWRIAVPLVALSAVIWLLVGVSYWFGLRAVFEPAPAAAAAFNMSAVALSFVVPLGPGGLGAFEAATILALAVFDIPLEPALAFAVIAHVFQLGMTVLFAAAAIASRQFDLDTLRTRTDSR
jgi:glycosyltransferase 2 family protein